jgi:hypothetical protein
MLTEALCVSQIETKQSDYLGQGTVKNLFKNLNDWLSYDIPGP